MSSQKASSTLRWDRERKLPGPQSVWHGPTAANGSGINQRGFSGEVLYTDPWLFDTDYELRLRLYGINATLKGYSKNEIGFQPSITCFITEAWRVSGFLTAKNVSIDDVKIEPLSLVGLENYSVFSLGISQTLDFRNNPVLPTKGVLFSTSFEIAPNGVGEVAYARGLANLTWYTPVTAKSTLAVGALAGVMSVLNSEGIPIDGQFFNGGATTVRSLRSNLPIGAIRFDFGLNPSPRQGGGRAHFILRLEPYSDRPSVLESGF